MITVTQLEPDRRLQIEGQLGPFDARLSYELEPEGSATRLVNSVQLEAHGPMRLAAALASGRVRDAVASNLGVLKQILER